MSPRSFWLSLPITLVVLLVSGASSSASIVYDWRPGGNQGLQGWTNVLRDTTTFAGVPYVYEFFDRGSALGPRTGGGNPLGGNWQDTVHTTIVSQSPSFTRAEVSHIEFELDSGRSIATLPANFAALPANTIGNDNGFLGVALMRVSDGAYLLQASKSGNGGTQEFIWDAPIIAAATTGDAIAETYALQLIDYQHAGWGHVGLRYAVLTVPEPTTTGILASLIATLGWRRKRRRMRS